MKENVKGILDLMVHLGTGCISAFPAWFVSCAMKGSKLRYICVPASYLASWAIGMDLAERGEIQLNRFIDSVWPKKK